MVLIKNLIHILNLIKSRARGYLLVISYVCMIDLIFNVKYDKYE